LDADAARDGVGVVPMDSDSDGGRVPSLRDNDHSPRPGLWEVSVPPGRSRGCRRFRGRLRETAMVAGSGPVRPGSDLGSHTMENSESELDAPLFGLRALVLPWT
jgi:hypothetical protein